MLWKRGCVLGLQVCGLALTLALGVVALLTSLRLIHDECRKSMIGRTPGRTCATLRWPVSAATYSFLYLFQQLVKIFVQS